MGDLKKDGADSSVPPVDDGETLLRLAWWPQDVNDDGSLLPTAFPSQDLRGPERGLSVDRAAMVHPGCVIALANYQRPKRPEGSQPFISPVQAGAVRAIADDNGQSACAVEASPTQADAERSLPQNLGHAQIISRSGRNKSAINQLRINLIRLFGKATPLKNDLPYSAGT